MKIKITKRQKLYEMNNDMCHNYYYLIHGRIYNDDLSAYRKFKFVVWFDIFDVQEFVCGDDGDAIYDVLIDNSIIKKYLDECAWSIVNMVSDYNNENQLKDFYNWCNDSIIRYNEIARHW